MCVPIQRVHRDSAGVITHVGGSTRDGTGWGLTVLEAATLQESRQYEWFVEVPDGQRVGVFVKTSANGKKFLTTSPDGVQANNLDSLPDMPNPLSGITPPFPLNIPGPLTASLITVTSMAHSGGHTLTTFTHGPLTVTGTVVEFDLPDPVWTAATPPWFWIDAVVPFPAEYVVALNSFGLERVAADDPARRRALEDAGKGWWSMDFVLTRPDGSIDPSKPSRLTEIKIVARPSASSWAAKNFVISVDAFSVNPYCPKNGNGINVRVRKAAAPVQPPPQTTTMPNVVNERLDKALATIWGLGIKNVFPIGPVAMSSDLNVDSQNPTAGATMKLTDSVWLGTSLAQTQTGVAKIVVSNQSNRATEMHLWLFDYSTGVWDEKVTVDYQSSETVDLDDGHTYLIAAVDPTMLNCHTGRPEEAPCVYQAATGSFAGDSNGVTASWQIT
jgi:hypothetical protein